MKNPLVYFQNFFRVIFLKIRFTGKLKMGWIQSLDFVKIEIGRNSKLEIGSYNQGRGNLYIGVFDNAKLKIADHCFFNINSSITCLENIEIGSNCKFGNNLVIVDHDHNYRAKGKFNFENPEFISSPVKIGDNVWCGANVVILRGTIIGDNCIIAAGSVIKGIIPANSVVIQRKTNMISGEK